MKETKRYGYGVSGMLERLCGTNGLMEAQPKYGYQIIEKEEKKEKKEEKLLARLMELFQIPAMAYYKGQL